jgi:hypothetical protein
MITDRSAEQASLFSKATSFQNVGAGNRQVLVSALRAKGTAQNCADSCAAGHDAPPRSPQSYLPVGSRGG